MFRAQADDLGSEAMNKKELPGNDFFVLLPPDIYAFSLSTTTWSKRFNAF